MNHCLGSCVYRLLLIVRTFGICKVPYATTPLVSTAVARGLRLEERVDRRRRSAPPPRANSMTYRADRSGSRRARLRRPNPTRRSTMAASRQPPLEPRPGGATVLSRKPGSVLRRKQQSSRRDGGLSKTWAVPLRCGGPGEPVDAERRARVGADDVAVLGRRESRPSSGRGREPVHDPGVVPVRTATSAQGLIGAHDQPRRIGLGGR